MSGRNRLGDHISKDEFSATDVRKDDISEDRAEEAAKRAAKKTVKKEPKHGGKGNEAVHRMWTAVWMLLCAILLIQIWGLNQRIEVLKERMDRLARIAAQQQDRLEELTEGPGQDGAHGTNGAPGEDGRTDAAQVSGQGIAGSQGFDRDGQKNGPGGQASASREPDAAHKVYLTFDDGPSANTDEILDILDRYGVKATFFVVGREGSQAEDALRRIVEEGHTLGMHSYTHDYDQIYESVESFAEDFEKARDYLYEVTGVESTVYRFPGGSSNAVSHIDMREFAEYLDSQEIRFFDWNISSGDGGSFLVPVEMLIENCTATIKDHGTSVVLMHDGTAKSTTLEALPEIIETIQAMEDTVLLPITDETSVVQHIQWKSERQEASDYNR